MWHLSVVDTRPEPNPNAKTESLGKQNIGGVEAEGTKTTVTIPAGEIGNERAHRDCQRTLVFAGVADRGND